MTKNQRCISFACVLAFSMLLSLPAFAQGTLSVKCVDQAGASVSGAQIKIQVLEVNKPKDKKSDGKGMADFGKVDDGTYRVVGRKEGMAPALYEFALIKGAPQSVTLTFKPGDPTTKLYFEDQAVNAKSYETLNQGLEQLRGGKFAEADKAIQTSLEINGANPVAYFYLAVSSLQQRKWDAAEEALKKSLSFCNIILSMSSKDPNASAQYGEIKKNAEEQLAKIPSFKLRAEGESAFSQKQYDVAAAKFKQAAVADPSDAEVQSYLAIALANIKSFDEAFQAIDKAIQLRPTDKTLTDTKEKIANMKLADTLNKANAILTDGDTLYKAQDFPGALKKYEEALPMVPSNKQSVVLAAIARSHIGMNNSEKAIASYKKAIDLAPDSPDYKNALAQYLLKEKKYEEALNLYADNKGGQAADAALFQLGKKQSDQGNPEVAALAFERAIKANPDNAEAHYELGMLLYFEKKNDAKAKELLDQYLKISKNTDHISNTNNVLILLKKRLSAK
jgi:tetratricopeptide (TPR) repeat protein